MTESTQPSGKGPGRPRNTEPSGPLGTHPMRQRIVEALIKGESTRAIAAWVSPRVSNVAVTRLRKLVIREIEAARVLDKAKQMIAPASINSSNGMRPEKVAALAVAGSEHLSRIRQHQARLDAELSKDGMQASDVSTLIKTDLAGIRLAAELDGSLAQVGQASGSTNTFNIIVLPSSDADDGEVIDVSPERV